MPAIYLRKDLYDEIIRQNQDVAAFVDKAVADAVEKLKKKGKRETSA